MAWVDIFTHWASPNHTHAHGRNEEEYARKERGKSEVKERQIKKQRTHLVNRLELFCDRKDGLNVVVTQLLNQVSDGGIVL